jgi:sialic acid synthase SpsE
MFVIADLCSNARPFRMPVMFDAEPGTLSAFIRGVARAGTDAVKVQVFTPGHFPKSEREAKRHDVFPRETLGAFVRTAHDYGIQAGASVFDEHAVDACFEAGCDFLKIASREAFNSALVHLASDTGLPVYTSFPLHHFRLDRRRPLLAGEMPLVCIAEYPTLEWAIEAESFEWFGNQTGWGWSSHTSHYQDVLQAVHSGATVIEKHFALASDDPEAAWSLLPEGFKEMCDAIKAA